MIINLIQIKGAYKQLQMKVVLFSNFNCVLLVLVLAGVANVSAFQAGLTYNTGSKWLGRKYGVVSATSAAVAVADGTCRRRGLTKMMPTCLVQSNVKIDPEEEQKFISAASKLVAEGLGKPESYVMVASRFAAMSFGGSAEPCAFLELISIGRIERDLNKAMSAKLCALVEDHFGVPQSRVYINFFDAPRENFGFNGDTFA